MIVRTLVDVRTFAVRVVLRFSSLDEFVTNQYRIVQKTAPYIAELSRCTGNSDTSTAIFLSSLLHNFAKWLFPSTSSFSLFFFSSKIPQSERHLP